MKIRTGFVSNSSSSSFICEVCGNVEAGYDMGLEDAGMVECSAGHTFCDGCGDETLIEQELEAAEDSYDHRYNVSTSLCPICGLSHIDDWLVLKFLTKKLNISVIEVRDEIRSKFSNYKEAVDNLKD